MNAWDDMEADELRAEDRAQRRRLRGHWCALCHGHTGPGSPCEPEPPEQELENIE